MGRKRSIVTDTLGLLLAVLVTAASVQDSVAGTRLLGSPPPTPASARSGLTAATASTSSSTLPPLGIDTEITARRDLGIHPDIEMLDSRADLWWLRLHRRLAQGAGSSRSAPAPVSPSGMYRAGQCRGCDHCPARGPQSCSTSAGCSCSQESSMP
ncbi:hypothetical protein GCM10018779_51430 [Streptomyces griseocarneus]|nr:hypothetical protein GCM10018779_51430 [Streptomyces griseocarneus]